MFNPAEDPIEPTSIPPTDDIVVEEDDDDDFEDDDDDDDDDDDKFIVDPDSGELIPIDPA